MEAMQCVGAADQGEVRGMAGAFLTGSPQEEIAGTHRGYYLKIGDSAHYISDKVDAYALVKVADKVLNDKTGYNYWIDYSHGVDVEGRIAWSNLDFTERFF